MTMSAEDFSRYDAMKLFMHHIYEFQKGIRSLVLCTMCRTCAALVCDRLCLDAVRTFVHKPLNELTPEEDFMLGAMLGYDIARQCERYCKRKGRLS